MTFDALLIALHDSLATAYEATQVKREPEWMQRLRQRKAARVPVADDAGIVDTHLTLAEAVHSTPPRIAEVSLSFDCELHELPEGLCVRIARKRFWRRRALQRLEILLHANDPIVTEVLIDGQLLRTEIGRPHL